MIVPEDVIRYLVEVVNRQVWGVDEVQREEVLAWLLDLWWHGELPSGRALRRAIHRYVAAMPSVDADEWDPNTPIHLRRWGWDVPVSLDVVPDW